MGPQFFHYKEKEMFDSYTESDPLLELYTEGDEPR